MVQFRSPFQDTRSGIAVASAKLPDDLAIGEFQHLTRAIDTLANRTTQPPFLAEPPTVLKVQYGSDFLIILSAAAGTVSVFLGFAKALDFLAAAGLKNEDRMEKRDKRLERSNEIRDLELRLSSAPRARSSARAIAGHSEAKESLFSRILPRKRRNGIAGSIGLKDAERPELVAALVMLAEYGVKIEVRDQ